MNSQSRLIETSIAVAASIGGLSYLAWYIYQQRQKSRIPTEWTEVGILDKMYAYPIKSCGYIEMDQAECTYMGLRSGWMRDRTLMVVNQSNNFLTARAYPQLLLVKPKFQGSVVTLTHPDMEPLQFDLAEMKKRPKTIASVWEVPVPVHDCGWEASEWYSRLLQNATHEFRLVYYASDQCRQLRGNTNKMFNYTKNDTGALPDETSFNLINEASIDDLNERIGTVDSGSEVKVLNFRPNFVLKGAPALLEDEWTFVKIGDNVFEVIKPCLRCVLTTIDPDTGIRNPQAQPLTTLKTYRQVTDPVHRKSAGSSPRMGLQMALRSGPGILNISDPICVA